MQPSPKPTVIAKGLAKDYRLTAQGSRNAILRSKMRTVRALHPLNFVSYAGESIGVLGRNGSGKSTFLRLIAGSEKPTAGTVLVSEQPTLLGVSAALQRNLSGRQNIRLGLLAMGLSPAEVKNQQADIADWAELGDALDRPLSTYSSGMAARLKFAIATAVRSEILLVDEALSTGDSTFAGKAQERMDEFLDASGTVFLVSHSASTIKKNCTRAVWLHEGELVSEGPVSWVTHLYKRWSTAETRGNAQAAAQILDYAKERYVPVDIRIVNE